MSADDADWMTPPFDPIALAEGSAWPWKGTPQQSYEVTYRPVERPAGIRSLTVDGVTIDYGPPPPPRGENPGKSTRSRGVFFAPPLEPVAVDPLAKVRERRIPIDRITE